MPAVNDVHCHFFSTPFFTALGGDAALAKLGWDPPGSAAALADRWVADLDRHGVGRAALIASIPGDAASVRAAVDRHPDRFVGFFMVDPMQPDAIAAAAAALEGGLLRAVCLFPSMHRYELHDERAIRTFEIAAARPGTAVFVHCGVLSVGVRRKLGLPSAFDLRCGNPAALAGVASRFPHVPVIVPHFGAGFFREALMAADMCPNIHFDTSSSNGWIKYHPGLTLDDVFRQALAVVGPERLLFGTDSSFFPRGWVKDIYEQQSAILGQLALSREARAMILGGNFDRLFPLQGHKG
jgi:predicted TIM-barrel fold metal-dependent hydrolase